MERFPKIALYRSFQKTYGNYDTKEHTLKEICAIGNIPESAFETVTINLYNQLSDSIRNSVCSVMLKEKCNVSLHKLMKTADYLFADSECWRQYIAGSREPYYFSSAIMGFEKKLTTMQYILSPICKRLHDYYRQYAEYVIKHFEN